jgi:uncharacterized protein YdaU (DUF1376 family)
MKRFCYVPWFHGDFLRSTAGCTPMEKFSYWMLLCAQFEIGPLPNDLASLASIVGVYLNIMTSLWPVVSKKFKNTAAGLVNQRMKEHKANCVRYRASLSAAGKKGMRNRWGKRNTNVVDFHGRQKPHE